MAGISDAEMEIMKALWAKSPQTLPELVAGVGVKNSWEPTTVATLLSRLVGKKAVVQEGERRNYSYRPLMRRGEYVRRELAGVLNRGLGPACPAAFFQNGGEPDSDELAEILKMIDDGDKKL
ncbi:MAG: BlaI/MecI/CopY family transcriptional regulator [Victivallaceae bacterium]|nr:BlaI/MecI/CopY family transcriptional regulator [Victivallaceae bacterium]